MDDRTEMLRRVQIYDFALHDAGLYLDTHPVDQIALDYFDKMRDLYNKAVEDYTSCYGPLTIEDVDVKNNWTWIEKPWPWEREA